MASSPLIVQLSILCGFNSESMEAEITKPGVYDLCCRRQEQSVLKQSIRAQNYRNVVVLLLSFPIYSYVPMLGVVSHAALHLNMQTSLCHELHLARNQKIKLMLIFQSAMLLCFKQRVIISGWIFLSRSEKWVLIVAWNPLPGTTFLLKSEILVLSVDVVVALWKS